MTDEELIARLQLPWPDVESVEEVTLPVWVVELTGAAADRIEALVRELTASNEIGKAFEEDAGQQRARAERLEAENAALRGHVADLLAAQECGCGYDKPTDVCLGHLPLHRKTVARAENAEARAERLEAALRFYARRGVVSPWVDDEINEDGGDIARAALTQKEPTDG